VGNECHQSHADAQDDGNHAARAAEHARLGLYAACAEVVFEVDRIEAGHSGIERADAADDEPCAGDDEGKAEHMLHAVDERRWLVGRCAEGDQEHRERHNRFHRPVCPGDHARSGGVAHGEAAQQEFHHTA
jgi:hypothetical protein